MISRRDFVRNSAVAGLCFLPKFPRSAFAQSVDAHIEVVLDDIIGTISPNIYGHFVENLSGVVYDGIWVGEDSKVPNVHGIRKELVDEMRRSIRRSCVFPAAALRTATTGAMAFGPADKRPRRTNFWEAEKRQMRPLRHRYDPNRFGTNEFAHFCQSAWAAQPYLAANVRSLTRRAILSLGGILQLARWQHHVGRRARRRWLQRSFQCSLLGRWQRILGMRREFYATGIRRRISPIHYLGAGSVRRASLHRRLARTSTNWEWTRGSSKKCQEGKRTAALVFMGWRCITTHGT